ncbi:MAG: signal recognition particle-docking protein FtsY [Euryarchaeota archaeon]|nr:signal recognition particle-docking protein FtsY [Euryarchaeota archaeon]|tara:strand:- start:1286 stop:2641 length:1356 start_codon:yes stop_codon:yes gene_type:complete
MIERSGEFMGLFDKFRKRVKKISEETDTEDLTEIGSIEKPPQKINIQNESNVIHTESPTEKKFISTDSEWDEWEEEPTNTLDEPWKQLSKKERKKLKKEAKKAKISNKPIKPKGSKVDLQMMRSTTGRQLVKVEQAPRGSTGAKEIQLEDGKNIEIDLGGGVVESGGRVIKEGKALNSLLEEIEWAMLESDISSAAVSEILQLMRENLIGSRLRKGAELAKVVEATIKRALQSILKADYWDFEATIEGYLSEGDKPVVIMLVGVNGTGKTTTTAKIAYRLKNKGYNVVAAASDTFRAGAIEQLEAHMKKLEIKCISSQRGGDSAAIARDAISHAKAKNVDIVLVDTAGRMQNKTNLMNELQKVHRVTNPHLVLFVGDALAGNDAVEQAAEFSRILTFDGAVLSKMDTDAKGGAGLSIAHATGKPIVLVGTGQEYTDLHQFEPEWLLKQLFE